MRLVVDSSVAVKLAVLEKGREAARALLDPDQPPSAPGFILVESANVLWKKSVRGELTPLQAQQGFDLMRSAFRIVVPDTLLLPNALRISIELAHPVYDCLYPSCAEWLQTRMVTADTRFFNKTRNTRFAAQVVLLGGLH